MKLLNVKSARSIWLLDLQDLNPKGKNLVVDLVAWIKDAYEFQVSPNIDTFVSARLQGENTKPVSFKGGRFLSPGEIFIEPLPYIEVNLEVYRDGLVAETFSSTLDTDHFLQELLTSASQRFELAYDESTVREKLYVSEVHVKSDVMLDAIDLRLQRFAERLSGVIPKRGPFRTAALGFWTDPGAAGGHLKFALECQEGKTFGQKRWFSTAPMQTGDHLSLLEELEELLLL